MARARSPAREARALPRLRRFGDTALVVTRWFSLWRGTNHWLRSGNVKSNARAIARAESKNKVNGVKTIVQTANLARGTISLREMIPFWFAVSSPLLGVLLGLMGAWFVTWLSA